MPTKTAPRKAAAAAPSFLEPEEKAFIDGFLQQGYAVVPLARKEALDGIREKIFALAMDFLGLKGAKRPSLPDFFDRTDKFVPVEKLNGLRLAVIGGLTADETIRPTLFAMARRHIEWAVGNEVAMQRSINLSVQLPGDESSLLPLHSDVWSGNSPYELVLWLPLVDCYKTKSMYVLPRAESAKIFKEFKKFKSFNAEELFQHIKPNLVWMDVPFGHAVIFTHSLLHGNRVNEEKTTRWTFNVRLKGLLTPYGVKELGETFLPAVIRPATRIGFEYDEP